MGRRALGALDRPTPGSTNPAEVEQLMEIDRFKAEEKLGEQLFWASIGSGIRPQSQATKPPTPTLPASSRRWTGR
jgi:hypothetical protein